MRKILVSITTTRGSDWRGKIKEIKKIREVKKFASAEELKEQMKVDLRELG